jgi:hypothetical protein
MDLAQRLCDIILFNMGQGSLSNTGFPFIKNKQIKCILDRERPFIAISESSHVSRLGKQVFRG